MRRLGRGVPCDGDFHSGMEQGVPDFRCVCSKAAHPRPEDPTVPTPRRRTVTGCADAAIARRRRGRNLGRRSTFNILAAPRLRTLYMEPKEPL